MKTRASFRKHPLHPMLIALPLGLWVFSFLCDILYRVAGDALWLTLAFYTMAGGIAGAVLAAIPGFIDYGSLKDQSDHIKKIATAHMVLNLAVTGIYLINVIWRLFGDATQSGPMILSGVALVLLSVGGWLGGEMVYVHRVGVDESESSGRIETRRAA